MTAKRLLAGLFVCVLLGATAFSAEAMPLRIAGHYTFPAVTGRPTTHRSSPHRAYATNSQIGSGGDVTADALVTRPNEAPCVVTLFSGAQFAAYGPQMFAYSPPPACPGPFAKIVFTGDFAVSAGVQFDRTASIEIGNVPIYFGTTAEPSGFTGPTWHVERDVTDDYNLLTTPQTVEADIFNIVNSTYTGVISGIATLQFYPATAGIPAATTPDVVLPLPGVGGGPQAINTGASSLSATYTLPTNVVRAYLDVYSQGQQNDEFYYTCAPNDVATELADCGNGPLRETEVSIDGTPAGAAPVTPWIFTGGIDPYLWTPMPGAQTLEFKPYRVNLTPFAGLLSNGKPHTISLAVDNADQYFSDIATLFVYRDPGAKTVTGAVTADNLVPNPGAGVTENLTSSALGVDGTIAVSSARNYEIDGYVNTSKGLVQTSVVSQLDFSNQQTYSDETPVSGTDKFVQTTSDKQTVTSVGPNVGTTTDTTFVSYPLTINITSATAAELISIDQMNYSSESDSTPTSSFTTYTSNEVEPTDTYTIANGAVTGNSVQHSQQIFETIDSAGTCYQQTITAVSNTVAYVSTPTCTTASARRRLQALKSGVLAPLPSRQRRR